ncbi:MAG: hypothetical protein LC107_00550 [Chitinophagales bacterium]|nr:hypothetical protein [Chitinophagales bacterium]
MHILGRYIPVILITFLCGNLFAQDDQIPNPPITVESFFGDRAHTYQLIFIKKMQSVPRIGFLGISNFQAEWGAPLINDYVHQGNITCSVGAGFDINAGFIWDPISGIQPSAGFMYTYANPELLIVSNPRVDVAKKANADMLVLVEYTPEISEKFRLYTRDQGLYGYNFSYESHTRSYLMLRAGLTYKDITIGLAKDFDYFGPEKILLHNIGGFIRLELF